MKTILFVILISILAVYCIAEQHDTGEYLTSEYLTIAFAPPEPEILMIIDYEGFIVIGDGVVTISMIDGSVTYADSTNLDEAAKLFWKAIEMVQKEAIKEDWDVGMYTAKDDSVITCPDCGARIKVWRY